MKEYSLGSPLWRSWYDAAFYRSVASVWRAKAVLYLAVLLIGLSIPGLVKIQVSLHAGMKFFRQKIAAQIPDMTIVKGEVHTPEEKPYVVRLKPGDEPFIVIDTTGKTQLLSSSGPSILVTRSQILMRKSVTETRIYDLSNVRFFSIDQERLDAWTQKLEKWLPVFLFPFIEGFWFVSRILTAVFFALVGLVLVAWLEAELHFAALLSLAIVSMTPSLILQTVLEAGSKHFPYQGLFFFALSFGYFLFAVNAATDKMVE